MSDLPDDLLAEAWTLAVARAVRIAVAAGLATVPLALYARSVSPDPAAFPLVDADGRVYYLVALLVALGFASICAVTARFSDWKATDFLVAGALPFVLLTALHWLLAIYHRIPLVVAAPVLAGSGVFVSLVLRYYLRDQDATTQRSARVVHAALTGTVAFVALAMVDIHRDGAVAAGVAVFVCSALLLYQFWHAAASSPAREVYAIVGALGLAELSWPLSYWPITGWYGGAVLATGFIAIAGLFGARLTGTVNRAILLRYSGGAFAAFAVLAIVSG